MTFPSFTSGTNGMDVSNVASSYLFFPKQKQDIMFSFNKNIVLFQFYYFIIIELILEHGKYFLEYFLNDHTRFPYTFLNTGFIGFIYKSQSQLAIFIMRMEFLESTKA